MRGLALLALMMGSDELVDVELLRRLRRRREKPARDELTQQDLDALERAAKKRARRAKIIAQG